MKHVKHILLSLLVALGAPAGASSASDDDPIFRAMGDELKRSMDQLKLEKHDKPYYISYRIDDRDSLDLAGSFGATTADHHDHHRTLSVDVHVGDRNLDNGNSRQANYFFFRFNDANLSLDDDYDAIRHKLWLETDDAYKRAVQSLENKKAELAQKNVKERPDDWTAETAIEDVQPKAVLAVDRAALKTMVNSLSSLFRNYSHIRRSSVRLDELVDNKYFVNSEGSRTREARKQCVLTASGTAQADDGTQISDSVILCAVGDEKQLPPIAELEEKTRALALRLSAAASAKDAELYQGPVLFEGEAAAEFLRASLSPHLGVVRSSDVESYEDNDNPLQARIGRRILPSWMNVADDPGLKDASGNALPGSYRIDDQGVKAQRVQLVEKGILKTLLSTRVPITKVKSSNGHARGDSAQPSNLIVESESKLDSQQLKNKLIQMGREEALPYVIVVRKLAHQHGGGPSRFSIFFMSRGSASDKVDLPAPLTVSKMYINDGHEEPLKNVEFSEASMRVLRDIVANGNDSKCYPFFDWDSVSTITTPSLLVSELELQRSHQSIEKPPAIPHPYFEEHPVATEKR